MSYNWQVRCLKVPFVNSLWRHWRARRGFDVGNYNRLPEYIRKHAAGGSFIDIGCMWGVNGEYSFLAEQAGAERVIGVDVFGPTPEFEARKRDSGSAVEFILGDATDSALIDRIGVVDVVFCAGVLYHHPSPFDLLVALRRICGRTLILRTSTIPEVSGLPNAAVYFPQLSAKDRRAWNLSSLGVPSQVGITHGFEPEQGYGNWFWGMSPSCVASLLETAGFHVESRAEEAFAQTFVCTPVATPFTHRLPTESEARRAGRDVSEADTARPA